MGGGGKKGKGGYRKVFDVGYVEGVVGGDVVHARTEVTSCFGAIGDAGGNKLHCGT